MKSIKKSYRISFRMMLFLAAVVFLLWPGQLFAKAVSGESSLDLPAGISSNWWATVQEDIRKSEYNVTCQNYNNLEDIKAAYQAPNRAHNLRTYFTPDGIRVISRTSEKPKWNWGLSLTGYGYLGDVQPVSSAKLSTSGNRIEYQRKGITEWYINDKRGLEQGFTLNKAPVSSSQHPIINSQSKVSIEISLTGNVTPHINKSGTAIEFNSPEGARVINYSKLHVYDATGRKLPALFSLHNPKSSIVPDESPLSAGLCSNNSQSKIIIAFDTANSTYPITIDPLATSPDWTAEGDQVEAWFGNSLSTAGDVNGDGYSDVIVGASQYDNGETDEGRAFVFYGSASGLSATSDWSAEGDQAEAKFGYSVSTAGDVNGDGYSDVTIGAPGYDNGETDEGYAFLFYGSASGLSVIADWTAEGNQAEAYFGHSVSTAGDINGDGYSDVIVGADYYDNGEADEGRAFVFYGSASGLSVIADWTAEGDQEYAFFGSFVSTAGDVNGDGYSDVIVGARQYDNGETDEGRAFVFYGSALGLSVIADWTAEGDQEYAFFGLDLSTAGDVNGDGYSDVIVGAKFYDNGETDEGRAFVFYGSASGLSVIADWTAEGNQTSANFGNSVSTAGDVNGDGYSDVIVGASQYNNGETDEGRAFVFYGSASGLSVIAGWTAEGNQISANFGNSVSTAGDVNGDGYSDVIVGARQYDNGETDEGRAFVFHGSASGLSATSDWTAESDQDNDAFGCSLATAGDVNGDGYSDVIVGASSYDNGETNEGRAFVYHGSASGLSTTADWTGESDQADAYFGYSVATAGDVNGDGYSDIIVGANEYNNGDAGEGRAFVYYGSSSGLSATVDWTAEGDQEWVYFGTSVATAGDVNGDGYSDVIVGARYYTNGQNNEGRAFVYHGSSSGLSVTSDWTAESNQAYARFGISVATAGDVNGDGYSDVIVGAYRYDNGETDEGRAFVYHGSSSGLSVTSNWTAESNQSSSQFGYSVATAGDVNGDGYSDVIVGAYYYDNGQIWEGRAFVYHGSASGLNTIADWTAESDQIGARFGRSVATAGDINGDGYSDVIVGADHYENGQTWEGRAFVYHGSVSGLNTTADWTAEGNYDHASFGDSVATAGDVNGDSYSDIIVSSSNANGGLALVYCGNEGPGLSLNPRQRQGDGSAPIAHLGMSENNTFRLDLLGRTPFGRGNVKLECEVKPIGTLFDGQSTQASTNWFDTGTAGIDISELVDGLSEDTPYHWRVRLLYDPATTPYKQFSRWLTMPWNGWQEAKLSTSMQETPVADELAIDLGGSGLWDYDGTNWTPLSGSSPAGICGWSGGLAMDFSNLGFGLWNHDGTNWTPISGTSPEAITDWSGGLAMDFGALGLWSTDGTTWTAISGSNVEDMVGWANGLAMDFGAPGLWNFDGTTWTPISGTSPEDMTGWSSGLAMDFGASGLWNFDGTNWDSITSSDVEDMDDVDLF